MFNMSNQSEQGRTSSDFLSTAKAHNKNQASEDMESFSGFTSIITLKVAH